MLHSRTNYVFLVRPIPIHHTNFAALTQSDKVPGKVDLNPAVSGKFGYTTVEIDETIISKRKNNAGRFFERNLSAWWGML